MTILKTPTDRRAKARKMRGMMRSDPPPPLQEVLDVHGLSRTHYYRIVEELEAWEEKATPEQEAVEVNAMYPQRASMKWILMSGKSLTAYARGEIDDVLHGDGVRNAVALDEPVDPLLT